MKNQLLCILSLSTSLLIIGSEESSSNRFELPEMSSTSQNFTNTPTINQSEISIEMTPEEEIIRVGQNYDFFNPKCDFKNIKSGFLSLGLLSAIGTISFTLLNEFTGAQTPYPLMLLGVSAGCGLSSAALEMFRKK